MKKKKIEDMKTIAEGRSGKSLSERYLNNKTKLKWQCDKGHVWDAEHKEIKKGQWCPICSRKQ